tara:strand:+ start:14502 stop:15623 length:1122 start_codon:yes stop_codon:yes gene_type:complete
MPQPLDGIRVIDFSTLLPGPMATLFLAEAGAEVIKVEPLDRGEEMRLQYPRWGESSISFSLLNQSKKSLEVNLKNSDELKRIFALIQTADVLVEQFRPGVMQRLGLDYTTLSKKNPKLIYCSITGYGQNGPKKLNAAHDLNYIGDTGLLSLSMGNEQNPVIPPTLIADLAGGTLPAFSNILLALRQRDQTGKGSFLDISMTDNLFFMMYSLIGNALAHNIWPENGNEKLTGGNPRYYLYPTKDNRFVAVACLEERFWKNFVNIIKLEPEFTKDTEDPNKTRKRIKEIIKSKNAGEWESLFQTSDCCCTIVKTIKEALTDPHFINRNLFSKYIENDKGEKIPSIPIPISSNFLSKNKIKGKAPSLGQDNKTLLN